MIKTYLKNRSLVRQLEAQMQQSAAHDARMRADGFANLLGGVR